MYIYISMIFIKYNYYLVLNIKICVVCWFALNSLQQVCGFERSLCILFCDVVAAWAKSGAR